MGSSPGICCGQHQTPSSFVQFILLPSAPQEVGVGHRSASHAHSGVPCIQLELKLKRCPRLSNIIKDPDSSCLQWLGERALPPCCTQQTTDPPPSSPPTSQNAPRRKLYWHLTVLPNLTSLNPTRLLVGAGLGPRPPSGHSALLFPRPTCHEGTHFIPRASLPSLPHWTFASSRWSPLLWFTPQGVKMPPEERY